MPNIKKKLAKKAVKKVGEKVSKKRSKVTEKKEPAKMGRPLITIAWSKVKTLCEMQCTYEEIAAVMECSVETLKRACKSDNGMTFPKYFKEKSQSGCASLRLKQFQVANKSNVPMLIHLGKQYLNQKDKKEFSGGLDLTKPAEELSDDELAKIIEDDGDTGEPKDGDGDE